LLGGARISLLVGLSVVFISEHSGCGRDDFGYIGGRIDAVLMRFTDATLAFPTILLAIVLAAIFGASEQNVIIILAVGDGRAMLVSFVAKCCVLKKQDFIVMSVSWALGLCGSFGDTSYRT